MALWPVLGRRICAAVPLTKAPAVHEYSSRSDIAIATTPPRCLCKVRIEKLTGS